MNHITDEQIRAVFLENGFTVKEGQADLKPYVFAAARALLVAAQPGGWKLVPRQPTEEMMNVGLYQSSADTKFEDLLSAWYDMFDAAPAP